MKSITKALLALTLMGSTALAAKYQLDPKHAKVGFSVKHLMISKVHGSFSKFDGSFDFDPATNTLENVTFNIDPATINTDDVDRDKHLRSPDFFDVAKFPTMTFVASKAKVVSGKPFPVEGKLTMRGVTKPITLDVTYNGATKDLQGKDRVGFSISGSLKRSDYGMTWNKILEAGGVTVSDEVVLAIDGEAIAEKK